MSNEFETLMHDKFQMSSMGELSFFLGLQVKHKSDGIFISQDKYVAEILKKFDFASIKIAKIPEFFENNNLNAQLQDKDNTICKLKDNIKSIREKSKEENVNYDYCEIETKNMELENKQIDSIKKTRVRTKEQSDSLIDKLNIKSAKNEDLKAKIQDKVFVITSLKNNLQKVKGKEIIDIAAQIPSAYIIVLGMFKLDSEPLAPRLLQNRYAHIDYLKYTQEQANILWEIVKQAKAKHPLDKELDFALRERLPSYPKTRLRKLGLKCSTSNCGSKPTANKKNDKISRTPSRNMKNKVEAQPKNVNKKNRIVEPICDVDVKHSLLNANSKPICATCNKSMFDSVHDMCLLNFVENVITGVLKFNAAQLQLNAAKLKHQLVLPVQVPAAEGDSINTSIKVNDVRQIQALIDKKKLIIIEISIRSDLHLEDAGGTDCLPTATIFKELARMGAKSTAWNEFSSTMASLIICLATNQKFNLSKYIFDAMVKHLDGGASKEVGEDSDHLTDSNQIHIVDQPSTSSPPKKKQKSKRKQRKDAEVAYDETEHEESVLDLEKAKSDQAIEIASLKKRVDKLEKKRKFRTTGLKRLKKVDAEVTLVNETQERQDEDLMFDTEVLDGDEMFMDATTGEKDEQSTKINDSITGEAVTTAGVEDSVAHTIQVSTADIGDEEVTAAKIDELTLAQTLIEIRATKPKVVITAATTTTTTRPKARGVIVQEPSEFKTSPEAQPSKSKDKGKAIMIELKVPLKRKDQVYLDEDLARNIQAQLDAEIIEEERLKRQKQEEANIALIES
ncbi:retrovirus-related pol polyprotein from transposon TNT 1-94 [Tanacetum coccineum]